MSPTSSMSERHPECSVVLATSGHVEELRRGLHSLHDQSIARDRYEVIVVDTGPAGDTTRVCRTLARTMPLRLFQAPGRGAVPARNIGVAAARAPICLVLSEGDEAHPDLLWQHVKAHGLDSRERVAVRGYSAWAGDRRWPGAPLELRGRTSFKTEFLRRHGGFDESLPALEDVELTYRLGQEGLQIRPVRGAVTYLHIPPTLDEACRLAEARGQALVRMAATHPDEQMIAWCALPHRVDDWRQLRRGMRRAIKQLRETEDGAGSAEAYLAVMRGMEGRSVQRALRRLPGQVAGRVSRPWAAAHADVPALAYE